MKEKGWLMILIVLSVHAAPFALEIIQPQEGLDTHSRYYKAYPGIPYVVPVGVFGGLYPFDYELTSNTTCGGSIDQDGIITWESPAVGDSGCTMEVKVTDDEGSTDRHSWTITVTTDGFIFLDAGAADGGDGSIASPLNQISDIWGDDGGLTTYNDYFLYFREGTYGLDEGWFRSCPGQQCQVSWRPGDRHPHVWLEYPGESVTIDHDLVQTNYDDLSATPDVNVSGAFIANHNGGDDVFIHGIRFQDMLNHALRANINRMVIFNCTFFNGGPGQDGSNSGFLLFNGDGYAASPTYQLIKANAFVNATRFAYIKTYSTNTLVIDDNVFLEPTVSGVGVALKEADQYVDVRANHFDGNFTSGAIAGNMNGHMDLTISFNRVVNTNTDTRSWGGSPYLTTRGAIELNHDSTVLDDVYVYRNTFEGICMWRGEADDGPFHIYNNVIVNEMADVDNPDGSLWSPYQDGTHDPACLDLGTGDSADLVGSPSDGIIDENGDLTVAYSDYLGTHGYQVVEEGLCSDGEITEECSCGGENYSLGYCCNDVWFEPYYSNITGGCPTGDFYYVDRNDQSADDANPGTESQPWKTMQQGVASIGAGDVLIVKQGTYYAEPVDSRLDPVLNPAVSGTSGNPVIIKAEGDVNVTTNHTESGTAQGGGAQTITLAADSSSTDDFYNGWYVRVGDEYARISTFDSTTKVATLSYYSWTDVPTAGDPYTLTRPGPLIGTLNRDYVVWDGFRVQERDSYHPDTGSTVIWGSDHVYFMNNEVDAQPVELFDNHNALRVEGSQHATIRNNHLHGLRQLIDPGANNPQNHAAIMIYNSNYLVIEHNEISSSYTCLFPKGGNGDHIIRYNHIHDCNKSIRVSYHDNLSIYSNLIERSAIMGFQPAEEQSGNMFYNNVIVDSYSGINNWFQGTGFTAFNNIFYNVTRPVNFEGALGNFTSDYNNYYLYDRFRSENPAISGDLEEYKAVTGKDGNSTELDPLFVDQVDYRLQAGSQLRSAGIDWMDHDSDGDTAESVSMGIYITGSETIGVIDYGEEETCLGAADADCDGVISAVEMRQYVRLWTTGSIQIADLMEALGLWKG